MGRQGRELSEYKVETQDEFSWFMVCTKCNDRLTVYVKRPE